MYGSDRMFLAAVAAMDGDVISVLPGEGPLSDEMKARAVDYRIVEFPILRRVELRTLWAAARFTLRSFAATFRLAFWLRREGHDVVYVSTVIAPAWIFAGRLAGSTVQCHVHESEPDMSRLASAILLWPLRLAHRVIANSRATGSWISRSTSSRVRARTRVVYNGVPEVSPAKPAAWQPEGAQRLVVLGRLSHRKGQDVAVRATALLRERNYDVSLTLVGDCYSGYEAVVEELKALVEEHGIQQNVKFEGYRSDPVPYLEAADIALVPSRVESFGLVAVESLMLALPTVATSVGGLPEIIADYGTGRLVPPGNPEAMAEAVAYLLDNPADARAMGRRGQAHVRNEFSIQTFAHRFREAIA